MNSLESENIFPPDQKWSGGFFVYALAVDSPSENEVNK